ncbi:MAG: hypothetical protein EHM36_07380, partial [Deltaproteobacteria bacterium]
MRMMTGKKRFLRLVVCLVILIPAVIDAGDSKKTIDSKDYEYVASKFSINYHLPTCKKAKRIQRENRVTFTSAEKAIRAGYSPCALCRPPVKDS